MECKEFSKILVDFLEGLLPYSKEIKVKEHIKGCEKCRLQLAKIKRTFTLLKDDKIPPLSEAKKNALFPLIMERIEGRMIVTRKKKRWVYGLSLGFSLAFIVIFSILSVQEQRKNNFYTLINPELFTYENDTLINNFIAESLMKNDTIIREVRNKANKELIDKTELTVLLDELSGDEMDKLTEKLKGIDFKKIL